MSDTENQDHGDAIAELAIIDPTGPSWAVDDFGATRFEAKKHVGAAGAPAFAIVRQIDPDEPWSIEHVAGGPRIQPASGVLDEPLAALAGDAHAADLAGLIAALPSGEYLVVRVSAAAKRPAIALLGNHVDDRPPAHLVTIADEGDAYGLAVGPGRAPDLSRPLLGVAPLSYTGDWRPMACLFFDALGGDAPDPGLAAPVVIVPRSGDLVFDNMSHYSGHDSAADRELWRERDSLEYAKVLAGDS